MGNGEMEAMVGGRQKNERTNTEREEVIEWECQAEGIKNKKQKK